MFLFYDDDSDYDDKMMCLMTLLPEVVMPQIDVKLMLLMNVDGNVIQHQMFDVDCQLRMVVHCRKGSDEPEHIYETEFALVLLASAA